jgi:(1->4)-alpha-D-glucan 1-alpha-D-glucosylmutase
MRRDGRRVSSVSRPPTATYRLQIHADFTLFDAVEQLPYLKALGVSAVYLSPLLQATGGSNHGYDVVDHRRIDPDRGGEPGLRALADAAAALELGIVVDIVPNHMGVADATQNPAWWELLRAGREGWSGSWFDVDWAYPGGKILIPVLGDDFDADRDLTLSEGELRYYEHRFPIADGTADGTAAQVHARQHYELVNFRRADTEQNYRRFFAVTELAGLRVEDSAVFAATHAEILRWVTDYGVLGIRIDHPDGLAHPGDYLHQLRAAAPDAWITVEKITEPGEQLPPSWPVAGMTGYDALAEVNRLIVPSSLAELDALYVELTGDDRSWERHVEDGKRQVATTILQAEIRRMARLVAAAPTEADEGCQPADVIAALTELVVAFAVYRSYLPLGENYLSEAGSRAIARRPHLAGAIDALLPRLRDADTELAVRFQQATGAVMAKGVEDTAYYRYSRLISLNEVGGYPGAGGLSIADFHTAQAHRAAQSPQAMTTLSTHDTKRGEDIRARIAVLAELVGEWRQVVTRLLELAPIPDRSFGYLWWQTVVATGLIERERLHAYAEKAMREASSSTRWIDPDTDFEATVHAAVDAVLDNPDVRALVQSFFNRIAEPAYSNSLSQKLVQLTMPGIPDVYQGSELFEDSLVDPDNRRPVDFAARASALRRLDEATGSTPASGETAKLLVTAAALRTRRDRPELFTGYTPLPVRGRGVDHLVAFDRGGAITVATRLPVGLAAAGGWGDTVIELPTGEYLDVLSGRRHAGSTAVTGLLQDYPVALLVLVE